MRGIEIIKKTGKWIKYNGLLDQVSLGKGLLKFKKIVSKILKHS